MFSTSSAIRRRKVRLPVFSVYEAGSHTHVFDPDAVWAKIFVTGGGANAWTNNGGSGSQTAISFIDIVSANADLIVGARSVESSYNDGVNIITASTAGTVGADIPVPGAEGGYSNANASADSRGGSTYWGSGRRLGDVANIWGTGGSIYRGSETGFGAPGVIIIEEYF